MKSILLFISLLSLSAHAGLFIDLEETGTSEEKGPQARAEATQDVIHRVSEKYIIEFIGDAKYQRNKRLIEEQVIKESGRYIPYIKNSKANEIEGQSQVTVNLRIYPQNLRKLLEEKGLLTVNYDSAVVFPLVRVIDRVNAESYKWWIESNKNSGFLTQLGKNLHKELKKNLKSGHFFLPDPITWNFRDSIPDALKKDYYRRDDLIRMGDYFQFPVIIQGDIQLSKSSRTTRNYMVKVNLSAYLSSQGRVIAESTRNVETEAGEFELVTSKTAGKVFEELASELSLQIEEAWKKGVFDSNLIKLSLSGDLPYSKVKKIKNAFIRNLKKMRSIKERQIESSRRIYEVDYMGSMDELVTMIANIKIEGVQLRVQDHSSKSISVRAN